MDTPNPGVYVGSELELFSEARNWRSYWTDIIRPLVGVDVLEVGAGIGSVTKVLANDERRWTALEPDAQLAGCIRQWAIANAMNGVTVIDSTIQGVPTTQKFDTILYIDVLEHIEADAGEMDAAYGHLAVGGRLIILVPAHPLLYSEFDQAIGHFRRYNKAGMAALRPPGAVQDSSAYLDSFGLLASLGNLVLLRSRMPSPSQVSLWDRRLVPISRKMDAFFGHHVGKSLLTVWRRAA